MKETFLLKTVCDDVDNQNKYYNSAKGCHSYINNLSNTLSINNLENIINGLLKDMYYDEVTITSCKLLLKEKLKDINNYNVLIDRNRFKILKTCKKIFFLSWYEKSYKIDVLKRFLSDVNNKDFKKYFACMYIPRKRIVDNKVFNNIIFKFNNENFRKLSGINENWDIYVIAFIHFYVIILITEVFTQARISIDKNFVNHFLKYVHNYVGLSIATGMELSVEFDLGEPYGNVYQELAQLTPKNKTEMNFTTSDEMMTFEVTIKNNLFLSKAYQDFKGGKYSNKYIGKKLYPTTFSKRGYIIKPEDVTFFYPNSYIDSKDISTVRITKGNKPHIMKVNVKLSGMAIISRLLTISNDSKEKIYTGKLMTEWIFSIDNLVANLIWRVLWATKQYQDFDSIKVSRYSVYSDFINNQKTKRNTAMKTAIVIYLAQIAPEKREELINKYFKNSDTQQKTELRKSVTELLIRSEDKTKPELAIKRLMGGLRNNYAW